MRECPKCGTCFSDEIQTCQFHDTETKQIIPGPQLLAERYFLENRLGRGAMGQVYVARDENLGTRKVAVKTVRPELLASEDLQEGEAVARFEREARAAASIRHPNIVDVTDFGQTKEGVLFLVMEYVKGETLHDLLRREGTLTVKRSLALLRQIGDGVEAAHEAGILHRDLKPANIFLLKTGRDKDGFIKVGDFGLAKIVNDTVSEISAKTGPQSRGLTGTPEFMSPEQMHSEKPIDGRSDIYALGTIAYLMLGGRVPYTGDLMQVVTAKMTQAPPPLSRMRTDISPEVERAIMHALELAVEKRPPTVSAWIDELARAAERNQADDNSETGRLVILAPIGSEVYVDDERKGSVGSSGRVVLSNVPPGRHVLRVARRGAQDDERLIEIREDSAEQVIQAVLRDENAINTSQPSLSQPNSGALKQQENVPDVVVCMNCQARFAAGVKFCGRCGQSNFRLLHTPEASQKLPSANLAQSNQLTNPNATSRFVVNTNHISESLSCPRCHRTLPANAKFCGACGLQLTGGLHLSQAPTSTNNLNPNEANRSQSVVCLRCHAVYAPGTKFCGKCGNRI